MKVSAIKPGMVFVVKPIPSANLKGGTFEVLEAGPAYESPNGIGPSTYRKLKIRNVKTNNVWTNPYLWNAELDVQ